jgi:hypothetical protein
VRKRRDLRNAASLHNFKIIPRQSFNGSMRPLVSSNHFQNHRRRASARVPRSRPRVQLLANRSSAVQRRANRASHRQPHNENKCRARAKIFSAHTDLVEELQNVLSYSATK